MKMTAPISPVPLLSLLIVPVALLTGIAIGTSNPTYVFAAAGALVVAIMFVLRLDESIVALVVAVHILVDSYLGLATYQIALLMALALLVVCYFGRSEDRPWTRPRMLWLWLVFLALTLIPMYEGGAFSLTNSLGYYLEVVLSPFIMFWLGNIIAKDTSAIRRVFQALALMAAIFALHTIIEATTGKFLFESARAQANLLQNSNFQLQAGVSRAGSFFGNPNGNGAFLATSFFLPLALFIDSTRFWAKVLHLMEMLAILLALMFTYSNGSWIAALAGVLIFLFLVGRMRYSVLLTLLIVSLTGIALIFFPARIAIQLAHAKDQGDLSLHLGAWATAFRVLMAYPLFGVGLGNQAYLALAEPYRVSAQTKPLAEPDNSYLQWGAIAGIPTMLIFLVLLGLVFWFAWRNWLAVDARYRVLFAGGICALIALSVDSLTVDGWTSPIDVQFLGWLIAGVIATPLIIRHLNLHPITAITTVQTQDHSNTENTTCVSGQLNLHPTTAINTVQTQYRSNTENTTCVSGQRRGGVYLRPVQGS